MQVTLCGPYLKRVSLLVALYKISALTIFNPAAVTFPPYANQSWVLDLATPEECKAELTYSLYILPSIK